MDKYCFLHNKLYWDIALPWKHSGECLSVKDQGVNFEQQKSAKFVSASSSEEAAVGYSTLPSHL